MIQQATQSGTKRCCRCLEQKALTSFRRVKKGGDLRRTNCNQCHSQQEAARKLYRRRKRQGMQIQKASAAICQAPPSDPTRVSRIAETLVGEFGGWNKFVEVWRHTFEMARKQKRYRRLLHMLVSVSKLEQAGEALRIEDAKVALDNASFSHAIAQSQTAAASVLSELGWTTVPPRLGE